MPLTINHYGSEFPAKWEICDRCNGDGSHGNPAFDGMPYEITPDHDEEFWDRMRNGTYNVRCNPCNGTGKVKVLDESLATDAQKAEYNEIIQSEMEMRQEQNMEMRAQYGLDYTPNNDPFYPQDTEW